MQNAIFAAITAFVTAVNEQQPTVGASFTHAPTIIDVVPPFFWTGPHAVAAWLDALGKDTARTVVSVTLAPSAVIVVDGTTAYASVPGLLTFLESGAPGAKPALLVFTLVLSGSAWKIATFTWGQSW